MKYAGQALCLLVGLGIGAAAMHLHGRAGADVTASTPADWVARIGDDYITAAQFEAEMQRRGGSQPGLFQDEAQKRALLDDMLLQRALVAAARAGGMGDKPETRDAIEQLLVSQYLQDTLRAKQQRVVVSAEEVKAYFDEHADSYTVPPRRRVAMIRVAVAPDAPEPAWEAAEKRAGQALDQARKLGSGTPHFGVVAREFSEDASSRYRGGVIGWLTDGRRSSYRYDAAVLDAAFELGTAGEFSGVLRGKDGVYIARLVETQPEQKRAFEQLSAGLEQRLMQERLGVLDKEFREATLAAAAIEVRESRLAAIAPPGPPASHEPPAPPAMPTDNGAGS